MSKSSTTIDKSDWLHVPHAGELLRLEFMEPLGMTVSALAEAISVNPSRLSAMIDGSRRIDGDLDLRLARYFRMSEGFFMGLQDDYELRTAKRALNGDLEKIVPRAA